METLGLSLQQTLAIAAIVLVALLVILAVLRLLARVGKTLFRLGCVLLIVLLLLVGSCLTWVALTGR
jgi:hypothetical protein